MKSLSISRANALSEQAGQSALSQVDSTSNYEDRVNQVLDNSFLDCQENILYLGRRRKRGRK